MIVWKLFHFHSVHWVLTSPIKITTPSFLPSLPPPPHLNLQTVQVPFLGNPSSILVFHDPLKSLAFQWTPSFPSLTPSYLLKVIKFFVKSPLFLKIWNLVGGSTPYPPPPQPERVWGRGGAHYDFEKKLKLNQGQPLSTSPHYSYISLLETSIDLV